MPKPAVSGPFFSNNLVIPYCYKNLKIFQVKLTCNGALARNNLVRRRTHSYLVQLAKWGSSSVAVN